MMWPLWLQMCCTGPVVRNVFVPHFAERRISSSSFTVQDRGVSAADATSGSNARRTSEFGVIFIKVNIEAVEPLYILNTEYGLPDFSLCRNRFNNIVFTAVAERFIYILNLNLAEVLISLECA